MEQTLSRKWDLDSIYKGGSQSEELIEFINQLNSSIKEAGLKINLMQGKEELTISTLADLLEEMQDILQSTVQVDEFLICVSSDNVEDQSSASLVNQSTKLRGAFEVLLSELDQLLVSLPDGTWEALLQDEEVSQYRFFLQERKQQADDKLPLPMEKLIQHLSINGFRAWENHYGQLVSKLRVNVETDGEYQEITLGEALQKVLFSTDRDYRQTVMSAIKKVCEAQSDSFASVLNHITGFRLDIYEQRGWDNVLKEALNQNRISQSSLNTMLAAIKSNQEPLRRFMKRKAELLKVEKLKFYDLFINTFTSQKKYSYAEAKTIIVNQFHAFDEGLGEFAEKAFNEGWIESEDRPNKRNGAFCASIPLKKESRILLTYRGNYQDIVTIAHELGHAYHNLILDEEAPYAREKGTSVAETASTFCENLVLDAALQTAKDETEKLSLLESKIIAGLSYLGMIPAMFDFEQKLYEKRRSGLLSSEQITELMREAEAEFYGDIVDEYYEYNWITTLHFYSTENAFYNIPYTIGYLFSNGVYSLAKKQEGTFIDQYNELLRNSGRMTVEELAQTYLHEDIEKEEFWQAAIQPVNEAIEEYIELTEKLI
ncbi:M3 family oligoendopeptidase [Bacillus sp. P14.5]|uniref:M3 family oligoendopeptidase n=1 Tax=Bacillus sp. P14.5 TaxID=1983400 RepID=UPI000DE95FA4|nr:M3 family oligoendopeptidase [Bacillus sp. P14.5]